MFVALHFHFCVGIADLKPAEGLERAFISWAAVTNDHKLGWLKAINIFLSPGLEPRSPKSRVSPEFLRDNPSHLYLASGGCNPQLRDASCQSLSPRSHDILLQSMSASKFPLLIRTQSLDLGHEVTKSQIRVSNSTTTTNEYEFYLHLITSAKILFPNKATFTGTGART